MSAVRLYARAATPRTNDIADAGTQDWPSTGGVAPIIVEAEGVRQAGVIVMGSHGRGDLAALLLGSVAHQVVHLADRSILIVR